MSLKRPNLLTFFAFLSILLSTGVASADRIVTQNGRERTVTGTILLINAEKITVDVNGKTQDIPANIVQQTIFDKEPAELNTARGALDGSRMSEALEALEKIDPKTLTEQGVKQDYDYLQTASKARLVLSGSGNAEEAKKALDAFIRTHRNSYHYYDICELYGDLMVQMEDFESAKRSYAVLAKAPWPEYSLKATVSLGMAEINENKIDSARKNLQSVLENTDDSSDAKRLRGIAKIGLALCLASDKKYDEAIRNLEDIAKNSVGEDSVYQAMTYNALGKVYDLAEKPNEAILAYSHTDILFSAARNEHIKALQELAKLWKKRNRADRAEDVAKRLKNHYNIVEN